MKVCELMLLLSQCNPNVEVNFVQGGKFLNIDFVESRVESQNWGATVSLYELEDLPY